MPDAGKQDVNNKVEEHALRTLDYISRKARQDQEQNAKRKMDCLLCVGFNFA